MFAHQVDKPECEGGGVVVLRTSAQEMASSRCWYRFPPLCKQAGLEIAQQLVPA